MVIERLHLDLWCLLAFVAVIATSDLIRHRIPNNLTVPGAAVGIVLNFISAGALGALHSIEGLAVGLLAFLPMFLTRGFGAGDVKAMAAVGAFLGPAGALFAALWTLVAGMFGGIFTLVITAGPAGIAALMRRWTFRAYVLCTTGHSAHLPTPADDAAIRRFPYGLAIACGTVISLAWGAYGG